MYGGGQVSEGKTGPSRAGTLTRKWTAAAVLLVVAVFLAFAYLGEPGRGRAAAIGVGVLVVVVGVSWDLRRKGWYWATVAFLAACHVPLIMFVNWTDRSYPGYTLLPIAVLDFAIAMVVIRVVERAVRTRGD